MEAKTLSCLNQVCIVLNKPRCAVKNKQQAISMYHSIDDRSGVIEQFNGQETPAFEHLEQARTLFHEIGNRKEQADTLQSIGTFQMLREQTEFGMQTYELALAILREIACRETEADLLQSIGMAYQGQKEYQKALEYCQAALEIHGNMESSEEQKIRMRLDVCQRLANKKWWHFWS